MKEISDEMLCEYRDVISYGHSLVLCSVWSPSEFRSKDDLDATQNALSMQQPNATTVRTTTIVNGFNRQGKAR
jgi:hypothetical protein